LPSRPFTRLVGVVLTNWTKIGQKFGQKSDVDSNGFKG
jgi:hypothetical protein